MAEPDVISEYLAALRWWVAALPDGHLIVHEAADHLHAAVEDGVARGLDVETAQAQAVRDFGEVSVIGRGFVVAATKAKAVRFYRRPLRLGIVAAVLLVVGGAALLLSADAAAPRLSGVRDRDDRFAIPVSVDSEHAPSVRLRPGSYFAVQMPEHRRSECSSPVDSLGGTPPLAVTAADGRLLSTSSSSPDTGVGTLCAIPSTTHRFTVAADGMYRLTGAPGTNVKIYRAEGRRGLLLLALLGLFSATGVPGAVTGIQAVFWFARLRLTRRNLRSYLAATS